MDTLATPCFLHVPKCGGISLYTVLAAPFGRDEIYPIPLPPPVDWFDVERFPVQVVDDLADAHRDFDRARAEAAKLVLGHFDFGVCAKAGLAPFTVLRDPVARLVSQYRHAARTPDAWNRYLHERIAAGMRLEDMAHDPHLVDAFARAQARQLAGHLWSEGPLAIDDETLVARALANLDRCVCVGLTERLDATALLIADAFGWPLPPVVPQWNVAPADDLEVSDALREGIRDVCRIDVTVYDHAVARFERDWGVLVGRMLGDADPGDAATVERVRAAWPGQSSK